MKVAVSQVWYRLDSREKEVYGPYRYCLHHCYTALLDRPGIIPLGVLPVKGASPGEILQGFDMLVLTGGGDPDPSLFGRPDQGSRDPERDRPLWDMGLYHAARGMGIPVLGICLGMQLMGIAHGAALVQHLETDVFHDGTSKNPASHAVSVSRESILHQALGSEPVVSSWHHQALESVPEGFSAAARAADGVLEAIESLDHMVLGVQWHPERDWTGNGIMKAMTTLAGER